MRWPSNAGNEITLADRARFVGRSWRSNIHAFMNRLKVHMDVPPNFLQSYGPSLGSGHWLRMPSSTASASILAAGRAGDLPAQRHNGRVRLCVRDDGPGPETGIPQGRLRFGVGLSNVHHDLKQLTGTSRRLELTEGATVEAVRPSSHSPLRSLP